MTKCGPLKKKSGRKRPQKPNRPKDTMKRPPANRPARRRHLVSRSAFVSRASSLRLSALASWARSTLRPSAGAMVWRVRTGVEPVAGAIPPGEVESVFGGGGGPRKVSGSKHDLNCLSKELLIRKSDLPLSRRGELHRLFPRIGLLGFPWFQNFKAAPATLLRVFYAHVVSSKKMRMNRERSLLAAQSPAQGGSRIAGGGLDHGILNLGLESVYEFLLVWGQLAG